MFYERINRVNYSSDGSFWEPTKESVICSQHSFDNKKSEHLLSPSFVSTIFPSRSVDTKRLSSARER